MAQSKQRLLLKFEDLGSEPQPLPKGQAYLCTHVLWGRTRRVSGAHWPARPARQWALDSVRDPILKSRVERSWGRHPTAACTRRHTHIHVHMYRDEGEGRGRVGGCFSAYLKYLRKLEKSRFFKYPSIIHSRRNGSTKRDRGHFTCPVTEQYLHGYINTANTGCQLSQNL